MLTLRKTSDSPIGPHNPDLYDFWDAYITAMLWADCGPDSKMCDCTISEIAPQTLAQIALDCVSFYQQAEDLIESNITQAGHDFWLTRQHHGAGFWDGDWPEPEASILTDMAHSFGEFQIYLGDDNLIYAMGRES